MFSDNARAVWTDLRKGPETKTRYPDRSTGRTFSSQSSALWQFPETILKMLHVNFMCAKTNQTFRKRKKLFNRFLSSLQHTKNKKKT